MHLLLLLWFLFASSLPPTLYIHLHAIKPELQEDKATQKKLAQGAFSLPTKVLQGGERPKKIFKLFGLKMKPQLYKNTFESHSYKKRTTLLGPLFVVDRYHFVYIIRKLTSCKRSVEGLLYWHLLSLHYSVIVNFFPSHTLASQRNLKARLPAP